MSRLTNRYRIGAVAALYCMGTVVVAHLPAAWADDSSHTATLQEVVVTANKRSESIQKVPISMAAVSADQLRNAHIDDIKDLGQLVPGLQLKDEFGVATPLAFIRGVGNSSFYATSIMPVGFYEDGVYVGQNIAQGLQLFDIDRIEVMRGPQGTLFGRNTTGGAINVITKKPVIGGGFTADTEVSAGDYGTLNTNAAIGGSIAQTLAFRLSAFRQYDNGVYKNVYPGFTGSDRDVGNTDAIGTRAELLWQPVDGLTVLLNLHWGHSNGQNIPNKPGFLAAIPPTNCPPGAVSGGFRNGCSDPYGFGIKDAPGFYQVIEAAPGTERVTTSGASAEVNWQLGQYTLTSDSAYDSPTMNRFHDSDGLPVAFVHSTFLTSASYWSEELRLTSHLTGRLNWVSGLYYYGDKNNSFTNYNDADLFGGTGIAQPLYQRTESYAIFGDGTYDLSRRWKLTTGVRETSDQRRVDIQTWTTNDAGLLTPPAAPNLPALSPSTEVTLGQAQAADLGQLIPPTYIAKNWLKWSGRLSLSYAIDQARMLYVSASHGFKGGEFNGGALFLRQEATLTDPEYVNNYELGFKGTELDNRLRTNLDVYYSQYTNQQVLANLPGALVSALSNAGQSVIQGVEWDTALRPTENWFFSLSGDYLDAHFIKFLEPGQGAEASEELNFAGNRLPEAPKWSFNALARYQHPVPGGSLMVQLEEDWNADRFFTPENKPGLQEGSYGVLNGTIMYTFWSSRAQVGIWGKNLLNKQYLSSGYDLTSFGLNVFQPGRPRIVGADIALHFD